MKKTQILLVVALIVIIIALFYFISSPSLPTSQSNETYLAALKSSGGTTLVVPPDLLSATQISTSSLELVWTDPNSKESGYIIFRGSGDNYLLQSELARVGTNVTKYVDTKIVPGAIYSYSIRPYIAKGRQLSLYAASNLMVVTTP